MSKPSAFHTYPWSSTLRNTESEVVAMNIMAILWRTGDAWRELTWDEYRAERLKTTGPKNSGFSDAERRLFDRVWPLVRTEALARAFCQAWAAVP